MATATALAKRLVVDFAIVGVIAGQATYAVSRAFSFERFRLFGFSAPRISNQSNPFNLWSRCLL
jgi:hypothetical protein